MTGAENLMNTVINSLSMIDKGFTVTLTVQPHNRDYDGDDYDDYDEEDDEDDEPHVSDDIVEEIKGFARRIDEGMPESIKSQLFDHYDGLLKEKYTSAIRSLSDDEIDKDLNGILDILGKLWPQVGDVVWYKTRHGNYERGKAKVVCHNTIQLDNNVTLERKDCKKVPFEVGDEVYFDINCEILCGSVERLDDVNCLIGTEDDRSFQMPYNKLFRSVDGLLDYLKSTADE